MKITYPVPAETTSVFVVVTDRTPSGLPAVVPWRMGRPHRRAAMDALGTPRLTLEAFRAGQSPWRLMELDDELRKPVRKARHHIVVSSIAPVAAQPQAAQVARAAARGVAEAYHGTIVDPLIGTALSHCPECPGERPEFRLGDDWLGWTIGLAEGATCPRVTTRGLRRFGLPEITLDCPACAHRLCTVDILRAVADRLLAGHLEWVRGNPGTRRRTLGGRLRFGAAGFAVLLGGPDPASGPFRVRLTRDTAQRSCLRVGSPDGIDGTANDRLGRAPGLLAS